MMLHLSVLTVLLSALSTAARARPAASKTPDSSFDLPFKRSKTNGIAHAQPLPYPSGYQPYQWLAPVMLGGYQADLLIDTGSDDLWVYGPKAPNSHGRNVYNPSVSSTASYATGQRFNVQYGPNNFASGLVVVDSVSVGGIKIPRMDIGLADSLGSITQTSACDGILGLGFQSENSIRPTSSPSFMETIQPHLEQPIFTIDLKRDSSGTLGFGRVDHSAYTGDLIKVPINNATSNTWTVDAVDFKIGGKKFTQQMIFDTGAQTTTVEPSVAAAYWGNVAGAKDLSAAKDGTGWAHPCGSTLPNLEMTFNGKNTMIPGKFLSAGPIQNYPGLCFAGLAAWNGRASAGIAFWLSHYVVFNQAEPSISFALKV